MEEVNFDSEYDSYFLKPYDPEKETLYAYQLRMAEFLDGHTGPQQEISNTVVCPYDENHVFANDGSDTHIVRCRKAYKEASENEERLVDMLACGYNTLHVVPFMELDYHHERCPDRFTKMPDSWKYARLTKAEAAILDEQLKQKNVPKIVKKKEKNPEEAANDSGAEVEDKEDNDKLYWE